MKQRRWGTVLLLFTPVLLPLLVAIPYQWANQGFLVDWLGCGCVNGFNANDFTAWFWWGFTLLDCLLLWLLAKRFLHKPVSRWIYGLCAAGIAIGICLFFSKHMMWN